MKVVKRFQVVVKHSRREEFDEVNAEGVRVYGSRSVPMPDTLEEVDVEVDFETLAKRLGPVACKAKTGKSVEASGLVVVKRVKQKRRK